VAALAYEQPRSAVPQRKKGTGGPAAPLAKDISGATKNRAGFCFGTLYKNRKNGKKSSGINMLNEN